MSSPERLVTIEKKAATNRLPDCFGEGAVFLQHLVTVGRLEEVARRLQIRREGGYHGVDVVLFLVLFFATHLAIGIKEFGERTRQHRRRLAALGGRRRLPAPASVSRIVGAVDEADCDEFGPWLLLEGCGAKEVLGHPAVVTRDALGESWHVFDFDPTSTVLRHRALPEDEELPPGRRRSHEARPGYCGRKRGDVKLSRATLQHAGSGLWTGIWTGPGNGPWRKHSQAAVQTVLRVCEALDHDPGRALLRVDGVAGNTPFITACQEAGVAYLTRWSQYNLGRFAQTVVRTRRCEAAWSSLGSARTTAMGLDGTSRDGSTSCSSPTWTPRRGPRRKW